MNLRSGVETAQATLETATWSLSWASAEPLLQNTRDQLASATVPLLMGGLGELDEVLCTGAQEALHLVLRLISGWGVPPQDECRRLMSEALTTLDEALAYRV